MSQTVTTQQEEVQAVKTRIAKLGSKGRRQFPESVRDRILALRKAGWPVARLATELGVAGSQIYGWAKGQQDARPQVLQEEAPARSPAVTQPLSPGSLQLRWGAFCKGFDPYQGDCVVFIKKDRTQLRALWGDSLGLLLLARRFDAGSLRLTWLFDDTAETQRISAAELTLFLEGATCLVQRQVTAWNKDLPKNP